MKKMSESKVGSDGLHGRRRTEWLVLSDVLATDVENLFPVAWDAGILCWNRVRDAWLFAFTKREGGLYPFL